MTPKHFFVAEGRQGTSNLDSRTGGEAITVTPNFPGKPDCQEVFLGISMDWAHAERGEAWAAVDADELRDAIDKAVGKREEEADWRDSNRVEVDGIEGRIVVGRETVGKHVGQWAFPSGLHFGDDAVANLNPKAVPASTPKPWEGSKPYRPLDRDRLLRHIEDVEAALTRRNERHERDQARIRELEAEVIDLIRRYSEQGDKLLASYGSKTAREYLDLAWEAAIEPEDGMIHAGEEHVIQGPSGRIDGPLCAASDRSALLFGGTERRLLEPRPEPSKEDSYRKELEGKGLAEWEIEILVGSAA